MQFARVCHIGGGESKDGSDTKTRKSGMTEAANAKFDLTFKGQFSKNHSSNS